MSNVDVHSLIDEKIGEQIKRAELTAEKVNEVLAGMIMTDACDLYKEGPEGSMVPKPTDARIKQYDRLRAIDIYYKRTGIYFGSGTTNNIAKMHVNILELNAAKTEGGIA